MAILEKINCPDDLKLIRRDLLGVLAQEIREKIINTVSVTGGHLAPSLGVVELTIAIHYFFNAPHDKIIWDVGHQAYAHKLLTGRFHNFSTLRQHGGISGFPKCEESIFDAFGVGHSSTSISAALGMAAARDLEGGDEKIVAVIGDGSLTGGMAFEGLNNAGHLKKDLIVILNDNEMFISKKIGAISSYFTRLITAGFYKKMEKKAEQLLQRMSISAKDINKVARRMKVLLVPGMLFEELGFTYFGPIPGHDINGLIEILSNIKDVGGPVLLHVITKKGKGYEAAEQNAPLYHGLGRFNVITGEPEGDSTIPSYTSIFGSALLRLAKSDKKIVAITAAMPSGTGLDQFSEEFPDRFFDVGIAEQHAVTFAAGLATYGIKPVVAIYSTFLQRAFDQVIHDVCLQNLDVTFILDRSGIVGEDGPTHQGTFDISYLRIIPNLIIMAPKDENELQHMLNTAIEHKGPVAIRFPRGSGEGVEIDKEFNLLEIGKAEVLQEGKDVTILAVGNTVYRSLKAVGELAKEGIKATLVNIRFIKPLDKELIMKLACKTKMIVTVEENVLSGGFGSAVRELLNDSCVPVKNIGLPDSFIEHGSPRVLREKYGLSVNGITESIRKFVKK